MNAIVRGTMVSMSARWALRQMGSSYLAAKWGVSPARARHLRTDDVADTALAQVLAMIADPASDGEALVISALETLELRYVAAAAEDRRAIEKELARLMDILPDVEADERRAWMSGRGIEDAVLAASKVRLKIVALRRVLGLDED